MFLLIQLPSPVTCSEVTVIRTVRTILHRYILVEIVDGGYMLQEHTG